jgi:hypothetical protein
MRTSICFVALAGMGLLLQMGPASAKGCIKGAVAGGAAGHFAGHGALGAAAGCVIGRHQANKAAKQQTNGQSSNSK